MPIETSMYQNMQAPDILGGYERGLKMRDMMDQRTQKKAIKEAYTKNSTVGPDGKVAVNDGMMMRDLMAQDPEQAIAYQKSRTAEKHAESQMQGESIKQAWEKTQHGAQLLSGVKDQATYDAALVQGEKLGLVKKSDMPPTFDPEFIQRQLDSTLTQKDRLELQLKREEATRKQQGDPLAEEMKHERLSKYKRETEEAAFKKTPEGRIQSLNSGDKGRLDNARLAFQTTQGMADALLNKGQNTFSPVGDNDFTQNSGLFEEAIGRMQSGGAIGVEEANRFRAMRPTFKDSPEMQRTKLIKLQEEMQARLGTLGFKPQDLNLATQDFSKYGQKPGAAKTPGVGSANAAAPKRYSTKELFGD